MLEWEEGTGVVSMAGRRLRRGRRINRIENVEEARDLALVLRAGALPARVNIIEERTVGPSLGQDSIDQGKIASVKEKASTLLPRHEHALSKDPRKAQITIEESAAPHPVRRGLDEVGTHRPAAVDRRGGQAPHEVADAVRHDVWPPCRRPGQRPSPSVR